MSESQIDDSIIENAMFNIKLVKTRDKILKTILNDDKLVKDWLDDKKILMSEDLFTNLFNTDYTRNYKFTLNLTKYLNTRTRPSVIAEKILNELQRENSKMYKSNFNPNLFFIFYDKLINFEITKDLEYKQFKYQIKFKPIIYDNQIIGLELNNKYLLQDMNIIRTEIINSIEIHSKILFNQNLENLLGKDFFCNFFINNCIIQKEISTSFGKRYIDLSYGEYNYINYDHYKKINTLDEFTIEQFYNCNNRCVFIEINEERHTEIVDNLRSESIFTATGRKIIQIYNTIYHEGKSFIRELILSLSKLYVNDVIKKKYVLKASDKINKDMLIKFIKLYMIEIDNFDIKYVRFVLEVLKDTKTIITFENLLKKIKMEFANNSKLFNFTKVVNNLLLKKVLDENDFIKTPIFRSIKLDCMVHCYLDKLYLNISGINKILYNIDSKYWLPEDKKRFFESKNSIEMKYINLLSDILKNNEDELAARAFINSISVNYILRNLNDELFFKNAMKLDKYKKFIDPDIPYVLKSEEDNLDGSYLKFILSKDKYDKLVRDNKIFLMKYIPKRRLINEIELSEILDGEYKF
jgi:hypothetical protein